MSRFRSEPLAIALCPGRIGIVHGQQSTELALPPDTPGGDWTQALAELDAWLADARPRGARASMTVAALHTRLCVVPWPGRRLTAAQDRGWIQLHFEASHGDMQAWRMAADAGSFGQPRLACALPAALVDQWHAMCGRHHLADGRLQPYFAQVWNRWRRLGRPGQFWGVADFQRIVWGVLGAHGWSTVLCARQDADPLALPSLAACQQQLLGLDGAQPTVLHVPGLPAQPAIQADGPAVRWLACGPQAGPACIAMAQVAAQA